MLDVAAAIRDAIIGDAEAASFLSGGVWVTQAAPGTRPPAAVVRVVLASRPFDGVQTWDEQTVTVDMIGDGDTDAYLAATGRVRGVVESLTGRTVGGMTFGWVGMAAAAQTIDTDSSPARPRWVLTFDVMVRDA